MTDLTSNPIFIWLPVGVAVVSIAINVSQIFTYQKVRNKIRIWAKDAKGMASSIVGIRRNLRKGKIDDISEVAPLIETLANFANSMYTSLEEELGRKKREIKHDK